MLSAPLNNEFLKMKPEDIPCNDPGTKAFYVDDLCLLTNDKMNITDDECWEKLERGQGWGIADDTGEWAGWARTFVYKGTQPSNSNKNWFLKVYTVFDANGYVKPLYECHVFEDYNCNPHPKCVSQVSAADVDNPDTIQVDPVKVESIAKHLEAIATDPNLLPYGERQDHNAYPSWFRFPSIGVDKSLKAEVWTSGLFSRIKARLPDGREI